MPDQTGPTRPKKYRWEATCDLAVPAPRMSQAIAETLRVSPAEIVFISSGTQSSRLTATQNP